MYITYFIENKRLRLSCLGYFVEVEKATYDKVGVVDRIRQASKSCKQQITADYIGQAVCGAEMIDGVCRHYAIADYSTVPWSEICKDRTSSFGLWASWIGAYLP